MFEIKWKSFIYESKESLDGMGRNLSSTKVTFPIKSFLFVGSGTVTFAPSSSSVDNQSLLIVAVFMESFCSIETGFGFV